VVASKYESQRQPPEEDVEFLDSYAGSQGFTSRSAVLHKAVRLLRASGLGGAYEEAWQEWTTDEEAGLWTKRLTTVLPDETRRGARRRSGPVRGSEANNRRPAVIVSNDGANSTAERIGRGVLTVVPVTSRTERVYPFQVLLPASSTGLRQDSKAQAEQVRSVAVERIGGLVGELPRTWLRPWTRRYDFILRSDPALDVTQRLWPR